MALGRGPARAPSWHVAALCAPALLGMLLLPAAGHAVETPFTRRVHTAIVNGLQWLSDHQEDDGHFSAGGDSEVGQDALAVLCYLERRESADRAAERVGCAAAWATTARPASAWQCGSWWTGRTI